MHATYPCLLLWGFYFGECGGLGFFFTGPVLNNACSPVLAKSGN